MTDKEKLEALKAKLEEYQKQIQESGVDNRITKEKAEAYKVCVNLIHMIDSMQENLKPKFKVGDKVRYKGHQCEGVITAITDTDYICGNVKLPISTQDNLEIIEECFYIVGGKSFNKSWEKYPEMIPELILSKQKPIGVPSDKVAPASIPDKKKVLVSKVWRDEREKGTKDIPVLFHSAFDNKWYAFNHSNDINWNIVDKWAYVEDLLNCTHSVTKISDQVESVKPKFKVGDKIYKNVLTTPDEQWEVEKIDEEKGEYHIRNMFVVNGLCFEDQDDWALVEQKPADNIEPKFKVGQKITDGKETVIVSELLDDGSIRVDTKPSGDCWFDIDVNEADKWKLVEEPISEDLLDEIHNRWEDDPHTKWPKCPYKDFKNVARHFANWQKQLMMKDAIEVEIISPGTYTIIKTKDDTVLYGRYGDKVKLVIIKED